MVLRSARIQGSNGHSAAGTAEIVREGGSHSLELRRDFRIDIGSVDVYLTRAPASNADGLNLGSLKSLTGAQGFRMPNDGSAFGYVLLWCRPFRVPVAMGELR